MAERRLPGLTAVAAIACGVGADDRLGTCASDVPLPSFSAVVRTERSLTTPISTVPWNVPSATASGDLLGTWTELEGFVYGDDFGAPGTHRTTDAVRTEVFGLPLASFSGGVRIRDAHRFEMGVHCDAGPPCPFPRDPTEATLTIGGRVLAGTLTYDNTSFHLVISDPSGTLRDQVPITAALEVRVPVARVPAGAIVEESRGAFVSDFDPSTSGGGVRRVMVVPLGGHEGYMELDPDAVTAFVAWPECWP